MNGGCRSLWSHMNRQRSRTLTSGALLLLTGLLGCGGDQRSGAAPADTSQAAAADTSTAVSDTASASAPDTTLPRRSDSVVAGSDTAKGGDTARAVAAKPAPPKPATRKPVARPKPPRPDTNTAATPTQPPTLTEPSASDTGQASTPAETTVAAPAAQPGETTTTTPAAQSAETTTAAPAAADQATAPLRDEYHRAPLDTVSQQVYDGWKQYNLNCARCHGEDVLGTTIAPHLIVSVKPSGPINSKDLFVQTVCAGRPAKGMPAWCPLGMEMPTIEAIYAYVKARSEAKLRPGRPALRPGG
jgi:hypothetical protein